MVVGGALAVASVAYGLGTQADDGTAVAEGDAARNGGPGVMLARCAAPDFSGLADELGVDAGELRQALRDFHEQRIGEHRAEFASALADALGIPAARVTAALEEIEAMHEDRFRARGRHPPLGIRLAPPLRGLAAALDVSRAELRKALRELRLDPPRDFERHDEELASFLADRFDLDVDTVSDALAVIGPPLWSPHRRGLPDHPPAL